MLKSVWLKVGFHQTAFPISRDPPEGGTGRSTMYKYTKEQMFPISRDPPEGGTRRDLPNY